MTSPLGEPTQPVTHQIYSGGSNTEQVRYSEGPQLFGLGPNHSKSEHFKMAALA